MSCQIQKAEIQEVRLIDKIGVVNYRKQFGKGLSNVSIPTAQLKNDVYILKIFDGKKLAFSKNNYTTLI